jgi:hypothetical protein
LRVTSSFCRSESEYFEAGGDVGGQIDEGVRELAAHRVQLWAGQAVEVERRAVAAGRLGVSSTPEG